MRWVMSKTTKENKIAKVQSCRMWGIWEWKEYRPQQGLALLDRINTSERLKQHFPRCFAHLRGNLLHYCRHSLVASQHCGSCSPSFLHYQSGDPGQNCWFTHFRASLYLAYTKFVLGMKKNITISKVNIGFWGQIQSKSTLLLLGTESCLWYPPPSQSPTDSGSVAISDVELSLISITFACSFGPSTNNEPQWWRSHSALSRIQLEKQKTLRYFKKKVI